MEVTLIGKLIDVDFEAWEFEGKTGVRFFGVVKDENKKLVQFKIDEKEFEDYKDLIGQNVNLSCKIFINGKYSLKAVEIN